MGKFTSRGWHLECGSCLREGLLWEYLPSKQRECLRKCNVLPDFFVGGVWGCFVGELFFLNPMIEG